MTSEHPNPKDLAYVAICQGGTGGPCCDPDCEKCWPDEPPPKQIDQDLLPMNVEEGSHGR